MSYQSKLEAAVAIQEQGNYEKAIKLYSNILKTAGKTKAFHPNQLLALCYHKQGHHSRSLYAFEKAIKMNPKHAATRNNFGNLLSDTQKYKEAKSQFKKAIDINPSYAEAYSNIGNSYQKLRDYTLASQSYLNAIEIEKN